MSSPSEFLTFYRRAVISTPRILRSVQQTSRPTTRSFAVSARCRKELSTNDKTKTDMLPDDEHSVNKAKKGDRYDVQTSNLQGGIDAHKSGTGGNATERKDSAGGVAKAKKEHPEAPDPAIGMQDERGGRGA